MTLRAKLKSWQIEHAEWRKKTHSQPELGFEEKLTSDFIYEKLSDFGLEVHHGIGETGIVASLSAGNSSRAIGLRADMDALPIQEKNSFQYRSKHGGIMHAGMTVTPLCCWRLRAIFVKIETLMEPLTLFSSLLKKPELRVVHSQ